MFGKIFGSGEPEESDFNTMIIARINARVQPLDRGDIYEDPLHDALEADGLGEVTGGGTQMAEDEGIEFVDIEIMVKEASEATCQRIIELLEQFGAPKGSKLLFEEEDKEMPFGRTEGLAVYLNGVDLDDEVYKTSDVNHVIEEFDRLLEGVGKYQSHWQGERETALYLYGDSIEVMKERIAGFIADYPLCQKCRLDQVA